MSTEPYNLRRVPLFIAAIALLGVPFAFIQTNLGVLQENPMFVMWFAVAALSTVGLLAYLLVFRHLPRHSPYLIFFAVFAFAAVLDFLIGLTLLGYTDVMAGYFESGEPYLNSNHGMAVNLWDGTVHFALYIWMSYCLASAIAHRSAALFWVGSMIASCIVYMTGNLIGEYAEHIEPSYLLNLPFMIVPIFYAWKVTGEASAPIVSSRRSLSILDYALVAALLTVAAVSAFRMLVVLNPEISLTQHWAQEVEPYLLSSSRYPQIQMLVFGLYLMPFTILAAISLWRSPSNGMSIWAWIFAGAVAQGQFAHLFASIAASGEPQFAVAAASGTTFWAVNLLVMWVPLWFAWRYQKNLQ